MSFYGRLPWWSKAVDLILGLHHRTDPGYGFKDVPKPTKAQLADLLKVQAWVLWNFKGRHAPRPDVWERVPQYAKDGLDRYQKAHPHGPRPKPPPDPEHDPKPPPSWTLPSPLVMSGVVGDLDFVTDPDTGKPRAGIGTVGKIIASSVCPLWECRPVNVNVPGRGLLGQIEGQDQLQAALDQIEAHKQPGDHLAIVGTGNVKADRMVAAGVTVAFYELNAQAGWEPYGNTNKILFQGHQDGYPYVFPSYGVYVPVSLQEYAAYHPEITDDGGQTWHVSPTPQGIAPYFAVFSGQGMGDTGSWPFLASL